MTNPTDLLARAKAYGCDIRATHESLMLVGDLAALIREQAAEIERLIAHGRGDALSFKCAAEARDFWQQRAERAESALAQMTAERDALRRDAVSLLRRARAIINRWQELYGEMQPAWLPPAHQPEWQEDATAYIDAAISAAGEGKP